MSISLNPEKVYVIGAAGFWLKKWPVTEKDREQRIFDAIHRRFGKRIEQERRRIERMESLLN
jgi:hypothetical protein